MIKPEPKPFLKPFSTLEDLKKHITDNFSRASPSCIMYNKGESGTKDLMGWPCYGPFSRHVSDKFEWTIFISQVKSRSQSYLLENLVLDRETSPWRKMIEICFEESPFDKWEDFADFTINWGLFVPRKLLETYAVGSLMNFFILYRADNYSYSSYVRREKATHPEIPLMFLIWYYWTSRAKAEEHGVLCQLPLDEVADGVFDGSFLIPETIEGEGRPLAESRRMLLKTPKENWSPGHRPVYRCFVKEPTTWKYSAVSGGGANTPWFKTATELGLAPETKTGFGMTYLDPNEQDRCGFNLANVWKLYQETQNK